MRHPLADRQTARRCLVMGVLNVTPDSFSDGGRYLDTTRAVAHGEELFAAGADLVDVGGESTRPGAARVDAATEAARVVPVIAALARAGAAVSIDTSRAAVAAVALDAGAVLVNDVSGGEDPAMAPLVAARGCNWVVMHSRGHSTGMATRAVYEDVVAEVFSELGQRVQRALDAGVGADQLVLDPGLGFAKTAAHNWALLAALPRLVSLGYPVLVGASRKSFLGSLLADPAGNPRELTGREPATTAVSALAAAGGAWAVRVHEVGPSADAVRVAAAVHPPGAGGVSSARVSGAAFAAMSSARVTPVLRLGPTHQVHVSGLRVQAHHGVLPTERRDGQEFVVDAVVDVSSPDAASSDDLADTLDYAELAGLLAVAAGDPPVNLLETLVERLLDACLADPRVVEARVTVTKPAAPLPVAAQVSLSSHRHR